MEKFESELDFGIATRPEEIRSKKDFAHNSSAHNERIQYSIGTKIAPRGVPEAVVFSKI